MPAFLCRRWSSGKFTKTGKTRGLQRQEKHFSDKRRLTKLVQMTGVSLEMKHICSKANSLAPLANIGKLEVVFFGKKIWEIKESQTFFPPHKYKRTLCETVADPQLHCDSSEYSEMGKGVDAEESHSTSTEMAQAEFAKQQSGTSYICSSELSRPAAMERD